jgi:hypothetical protein
MLEIPLERLDYEARAADLPKTPRERFACPVFGEIVSAIAIQCHSKRITKEDILLLLGEPDSIRHSEFGEVWEYKWWDTYGPSIYHSATPLVLVNGVVIGLLRTDDRGARVL